MSSLGCQGLDLSVKTLPVANDQNKDQTKNPTSSWLKEKKMRNLLVLIIEKSRARPWLQEWLDAEFSWCHQDVISLLSVLASFQVPVVSPDSFSLSLMGPK